MAYKGYDFDELMDYAEAYFVNSENLLWAIRELADYDESKATLILGTEIDKRYGIENID